MPNLVVRVTTQERESLRTRAAAAGMDVSALVRRALDLERDLPDFQRQLDLIDQLAGSLDRRVARLEEMAGLG